jgi:glutamate decarboxylase
MPLHKHKDPARDGRNSDQVALNPMFSGTAETTSIPRLRIPPGELAPDAAAQLIRDELLLDGSARLNLATFVTTWMEPQAAALMGECADKNMIDKDEYPQTAELERRCINILAELWHADADGQATGCSTTGSSEAAMLAGLALLWRWRQRRSRSGSGEGRPNLVMGINVQVCWEKFCRYWDVEARYAPMEADRRHLTAESALPLVDDNTIGVVAILGSTQDGSYEPVAEICAALDRLLSEGGPDVPVHVDAASGGFIAPFIQPDLEWDFRLPRVSSINASGHKYGLVYPGVGWALWRDADALPEDLIFHVNYLGGSMPTFALNFSRPGAQVVAQYYQLIRLGREGYRRVQQASQDVARHLSSQIAQLGPYHCLTDGSDLPVFVFRLDPGEDRYSVFDVSDGLRKRGWQVPAYSFPENLTDVSVLRVVVRNGFGRDLADMFLQDLTEETKQLDALHHSLPQPGARESFHH